jgi:hypothetical protein
MSYRMNASTNNFLSSAARTVCIIGASAVGLMCMYLIFVYIGMFTYKLVAVFLVLIVLSNVFAKISIMAIKQHG